jgi:hypothetical protein
VTDGLVTLHNGHRVPLRGPGSYYGDFSDILIFNRGVHEPLEEYAFQELMRVIGREPIMFELGAYWAHYSMWLKLRRPDARTILVEPDPINLIAGQENFSRHGYSGEFIQAFVRQDGFIVDDFLLERRIAHLDVLHSDIQGDELAMLEGAAKALGAHAVDYVFLSTHSNGIHYSALETLKGAGYRIEVSSDFADETTSFDGFMLASAPAATPVMNQHRPFGRAEILTLHPHDLIKRLSEIAKI